MDRKPKSDIDEDGLQWPEDFLEIREATNAEIVEQWRHYMLFWFNQQNLQNCIREFKKICILDCTPIYVVVVFPCEGEVTTDQLDQRVNAVVFDFEGEVSEIDDDGGLLEGIAATDTSLVEDLGKYLVFWFNQQKVQKWIQEGKKIVSWDIPSPIHVVVFASEGEGIPEALDQPCKEGKWEADRRIFYELTAYMEDKNLEEANPHLNGELIKDFTLNWLKIDTPEQVGETIKKYMNIFDNTSRGLRVSPSFDITVIFKHCKYYRTKSTSDPTDSGIGSGIEKNSGEASVIDKNSGEGQKNVRDDNSPDERDEKRQKIA